MSNLLIQLGGHMDHTLHLSESLEDYLEAISLIIKENGVAKSMEIADFLKVKRSSVTVALKNLREKGMIEYQKYRPIVLTALGQQTADEIIFKHKTLENFFTKVLAVDQTLASDAACRMEHAIGKTITDRLVQFVDFIERCPRAGSEWIHGFGYVCNEMDNKKSCLKCMEENINEYKNKTENKEKETENMTLDLLSKGDKGIVLSVGGDRAFKSKIASMGLLKNTSFCIERIAPMGDPISIKFKGYELSLRKEETKQIMIKKEV